MCDGAVEKTRTSTGCPTATSTLRVYQFRHDRIATGAQIPASRALEKGDSSCPKNGQRRARDEARCCNVDAAPLNLPAADITT